MPRIVDVNFSTEDKEELSLRPQKLKEYIGQNDMKHNLEVYIGAAKNRDECLDHVLLYGPPGLGKTTLANIIANEMNTEIINISGPTIEKPGDLVAILNDLKGGEVVFIDEIHRLPKVVEETLYSAMEDFKLNFIVNKDLNATNLSINIAPFTLVGATTRVGDISSPLRARFGIVEKLNFYSVNELKDIVTRAAKVLNCEIKDDAANEIAKRSRGTPRIANRLLRRVRDFANFEGKNIIDKNDASKALFALKVDNIGLDDVDIRYLKTLVERFNGGPVGLETLASAIGEEITNLEDVYEPYLIQIGFLDRTARGRIATKKAYAHLKISLQEKLF